MDAINLFDAKNRLSALIDQVEARCELVITRRGKPVARLRARRTRGALPWQDFAPSDSA